MSKNVKTHSDVTSADDKYIGFEYQYYYFLLLLLKLEEGQTIGLEVKDDVHIEDIGGKLSLIQLKHSINPSEQNITEKGHDLWKTLSKWSKIISDKEEGRGMNSSQQKFCSNTEFILVSNKGLTARNRFYKNITDSQKGVIDFKKFKEYVLEIKKNTKDESVIEYIENVLKLDDSVAEMFFKNVKIVHGFDDLIKKIKSKLRSMHIKEQRINDLLAALDGTLRRDNYDNIKNKKKNIISFEEFSKKYAIYFEVARSSKLVINRAKLNVVDPLNQIFIKQLIDIEDIGEDDLETIIEYSKHKLVAFNNLSRWLQNGDISELDLENFDADSKLKWSNIHKKVHRSAKALLEKNDNSVDKALANFSILAQNCLDQIKCISLSLNIIPRQN